MSWTFEEIGESGGLEGERLFEYWLYMKIRWGDNEGQGYFLSYATEWVERFKNEIEYEMSDNEGKAVLDKIHNEEYIKEWGEQNPEELEEWQAETVCNYHYPDCETCPWYEDLGYQGSMTLTPGNSIGTNISVFLRRCKWTGEEWEKWI